MTDTSGNSFRWEDLDQRLISPKTNDLAQEMQKRSAEAERKLSFEVSQSGNSAGYLPRLFDFHEELTNEWAEKLYAVHCEVCRQQNQEISAEFIRAVRGHAVLTMIAARTSTVLSGVTQRGVRTGKPPNSAALGEWSRRMDRLAHRWSSSLEAEAVAREYQERAKGASDPDGSTLPHSARAKSPEWTEITPQHLIPAIKHIRAAFDTSVWKCSTITSKYCYAVLHPEEISPVSLAPYRDAFEMYRAIIGPAAEKQFINLLQVGSAPALFKAFSDAFLVGLKVEIGDKFKEFLAIGQTNAKTVNAHPIEWAKTHLQILIHGEDHTVKRWIKEVCDKQNQSNATTDADFDELLFWKTWRAPRLIHMQPSGNTASDQATEWVREDEPRTQSLLDSLSHRVLQFLEIHLDQIVGDAYVKLAKNEESLIIPKPEAPHRPPRAVSQAPPPPTILRGSGFIPRDPEPSQPLLDFPPYYPNHLKPRTSVVIGEAVKRFPVQSQIIDLLKDVISGLTPDFSVAVQEKTLRPDLALTGMNDLIHSLSVHNSARHEDTFRLEQDARKSDAWLEFAKEIAAGGMAMPGPTRSTGPAQQGLGGTTQPDTSATATWDAIEIQFISDERVQIRNGTNTQTLNYEEFGFSDSRNGSPNQAWVLLRTLAEKRGTIRNATEAGQVWAKVEKRVQEIRRVLRARFGIVADPIPFIEGTGYQANFKIGCRRSYET